MSRVPAWAVLGFLGGVMLHAAFPFDQTPAFLMQAVGLTAVVGVFVPTAYRMASIALVVGVLIGLWRFDLTLPLPVREPEPSFTGTVGDVGRYDILVRDDTSGVTVSVVARARIGDRLRVRCKQMQPIAHDAKALYNARKGAWFICRGPSTNRIGGPPAGDVRRLLDTWRSTLTARIASILPGDAGALLSGMLYGERGLSAQTSAAFKLAGMTHLIAVSGSNIAMVSALFVPLFLSLGYRRKAAIWLSGAAITLFVIFVGAQASVLRAAVMGWLALLARVFGRKASAMRLLVIAAAVIVVFDPWALSFDAGFALSFLATWGLLSWSRPIAERLRWMPEAFGLREAASTTIAATVVTSPYSFWAFGASSVAGLVTNLFAVPLVGFAMFWGAVALAVGPSLQAATLPAAGALNAMLLIAHIAEQFPFLKIAWTMPTWALFLFYAVMIGYPHFCAQRQKARGRSARSVETPQQAPSAS